MSPRSSSGVAAGGTRTTVSLSYVGMIEPASRTRSSGSRPAWTARIPCRSRCRNMMMPRSVAREVLEAVDGDRPLAHLGFVVAGVGVARVVGASGELTGEHVVAIRPPRGGGPRHLAHVPEFDEKRV